MTSEPAPSVVHPFTPTTFPLFGITSAGKCACNNPQCKRPGKHPALRWGELPIGHVSTAFEGAGLGLVTGYKSGVFVVDTDGAEADAAFLEALEGYETLRVATPSGGAHYYFRWPGFAVKNSAGELAPKTDIRGDGGYTVCPGSPHVSGKTYDVTHDVDPAPAPAWLLSWSGLKGRSLTESESAVPVFPVDVNTPHGAERVELGKRACLEFAPSIMGESGSAAFWALALHLVRTLQLPVDVAEELVHAHYNPRCEPAWSGPEVLHKLEDARDKSERMPGYVSPELQEAIGNLASKTIQAPPLPTTRKRSKPGHKYTFQVGDVSNGEKRAGSLSEVSRVLATSEEWAGVLQLDHFTGRILAVDPPVCLDAESTGLTDNDVTLVRMWFDVQQGLTVSANAMNEAIVSSARANSYHAVQEYLEELPEGDPTYLDALASRLFGPQPPIVCAFLRKFLISSAKRALMPGEKVDTVLLLIGPQGCGKSTFVRELFGHVWTAEDLPKLGTVAAQEHLQGAWGVEIAELDRILRADPETTKSFLSRCVDKFRPAYGRHSTNNPRMCTFVGTSNTDQILRDPSGARRFWPVRVEHVDVAYLKANRDKVWASAMACVVAGESHVLTHEERALHAELCKGHEEQDPWHDILREFCKGKECVRSEDALTVLGVEMAKRTRKELFRVTSTLERLGCRQGFKGKHKLRVFWVPKELQEECPPKPKDQAARDAV